MPRRGGKELNKSQNTCLNPNCGVSKYKSPERVSPGCLALEIAIATPSFGGSVGGGGRGQERLLDLWLTLVAVCRPENHVVLCSWIVRGFVAVCMVHTAAEASWSEGSVWLGRRRRWVRLPAVLLSTVPREPGLCWEVGMSSLSFFNSRLAQGILKRSFSNLCYKTIKLNLEWGKFCLSWLSLASRFISLYARTGVTSTGENKVCSSSTTETMFFCSLKKHWVLQIENESGLVVLVLFWGSDL